MAIKHFDVIPVMTSNTAPSGVVSASSNAGTNYLPYYTFKKTLGEDPYTWATTQNLPQWISYQFPTAKCIKKLVTYNRNEEHTSGSAHNNRAVSAFTFQGSNDGTNWTDLKSCTSPSSAGHYMNEYDISNNDTEYLYYRLYITGNFNNATGTGCGFAAVYMYEEANVISIYENGRIINNNEIITTTFTPESVFYPDGTPAVQNVDNYLDFVSYPGAHVWRDSYLRTGIEIKSGEDMVFYVEESLTDYYDTKYVIPAQTSGELCITFDSAHWDDSDTRNKTLVARAEIGIPTEAKSGATFGNEIAGNYYYAYGVQRPLDKIKAIYLKTEPSMAGDIEAIRDWAQTTRYVKNDVDYFFMKMVNDGLSPYMLTFEDLPDSVIEVEGDTSGEIYTIEMKDKSSVTKLLFFDEGESIFVTDGIITLTKSLNNHQDTVKIRKAMYYYGDLCEDVTGGWETTGAKTWSGSPTTTAQPPTIQYNADNVYLEHDTGNNAWVSKCGAWKPINKIDLTGYSKICLYFNAYCYNYRTSQGMNAVCSLSLTDTMEGVITDNTGDGGVADQFERMCISENGNPREKHLPNCFKEITINSAAATRGEDYTAFVVEANTGKAQLRLKAVVLQAASSAKVFDEGSFINALPGTDITNKVIALWSTDGDASDRTKNVREYLGTNKILIIGNSTSIDWVAESNYITYQPPSGGATSWILIPVPRNYNAKRMRVNWQIVASQYVSVFGVIRINEDRSTTFNVLYSASANVAESSWTEHYYDIPDSIPYIDYVFIGATSETKVLSITLE